MFGFKCEGGLGLNSFLLSAKGMMMEDDFCVLAINTVNEGSCWVLFQAVMTCRNKEVGVDHGMATLAVLKRTISANAAVFPFRVVSAISGMTFDADQVKTRDFLVEKLVLFVLIDKELVFWKVVQEHLDGTPLFEQNNYRPAWEAAALWEGWIIKWE